MRNFAINALQVFVALLIFVSLLPAFVAARQTELADPYDYYKKGLELNNYLHPIVELKRLEKQYETSEMQSRYSDYLSNLYAYVGYYKTAYSFNDRLRNPADPSRKDLNSSRLDSYSPRNAVELIDSLANKHQVVMINEEHDTPLHRAFTTRLLPILYAKGFRYLAAETLYEDDKELNKRGYPTQKTGFYSADPVFGQMIRVALRLGFKLIPYEHIPQNCQNPADKPMYCFNERERGQAQNIYDRILKSDPKAKVLVHVGRGHNQQVNDRDWAMMAWHFKDISKIDPLSINQMMSERSDPKFEPGLYRYVLQKWEINEPTAFESQEGKFWGGFGYDIEIFHPRSIYQEGRPTWLKNGGARKPYAIFGKIKNGSAKPFLSQTGGVFLVQAFVRGESNDAIPIDQIIISDTKKVPVLVLPAKEKLRIRVIDEKGKVIMKKILED